MPSNKPMAHKYYNPVGEPIEREIKARPGFRLLTELEYSHLADWAIKRPDDQFLRCVITFDPKPDVPGYLVYWFKIRGTTVHQFRDTGSASAFAVKQDMEENKAVSLFIAQTKEIKWTSQVIVEAIKNAQKRE